MKSKRKSMNNLEHKMTMHINYSNSEIGNGSRSTAKSGRIISIKEAEEDKTDLLEELMPRKKIRQNSHQELDHKVIHKIERSQSRISKVTIKIMIIIKAKIEATRIRMVKFARGGISLNLISIK